MIWATWASDIAATNTKPALSAGMWNGRCENPDCEYHWNPKEDEEDE